jgi:hypothetical protein
MIGGVAAGVVLLVGLTLFVFLRRRKTVQVTEDKVKETGTDVFEPATLRIKTHDVAQDA